MGWVALVTVPRLLLRLTIAVRLLRRLLELLVLRRRHAGCCVRIVCWRGLCVLRVLRLLGPASILRRMRLLRGCRVRLLRRRVCILLVRLRLLEVALRVFRKRGAVSMHRQLAGKTPRYGLLSCRGKSAGVAYGPVSDLPPKFLKSRSQLFRR
jgi:hypothetical protein